jgi:hypothetical protein
MAINVSRSAKAISSRLVLIVRDSPSSGKLSVTDHIRPAGAMKMVPCFRTFFFPSRPWASGHVRRK